MLIATIATALGIGLSGAASAAADPAASYFPLPSCCPMQEVQAGGGLVVLGDENGEHGYVLRLDPATGAVTGQLDLFVSPVGNNDYANFFSAPKLAVADGSVWFSSYFDNRVYRLNAVTLAVEDIVKTGRSPASLIRADGSLWVTLNNDQAIQRIDPVHDRVTATIKVGNQSQTDQPSRIAWTGTQLLVSLPATGRVAHVSPRGRVLGYDRVGDAAGYSLLRIDPVPGGYWLDDTDGGTTYWRWSYARHRLTRHFDTQGGWGSVVARGVLYTGGAVCDSNGNCTQGLVEKHDPTTGRLLATRRFGPVGAWFPQTAFGGLWTTDFNQLQRSALF